MEEFYKILVVVGISAIAIQISYVISPYIGEVVSVAYEKVMHVPLDVKYSSDFIFCLFTSVILVESGLTILNLILNDHIIIHQVAQLHNLGIVNEQVIVPLVTTIAPTITEQIVEVIPSTIKYQSLSDSINTDLILLNELKCVTTMSQQTIDNISNAILIKWFDSGIFLQHEDYKYYVNLYESGFYNSAIENVELINLIQNAPILRKYFLYRMLKMDSVNYADLIAQCNLNSEFEVYVQLLETFKYSHSLGGVYMDELVLRNLYGLQLISENPHYFNGIFFIDENYGNRLNIFRQIHQLINGECTSNIISGNYFNYDVSMVLDKARVFKIIKMWYGF